MIDENREIKFRIWQTNIKRMDFFTLFNGWHTSLASDPRNWLSGVVMQYTGLKDKNGKEIYESDLVKGQAEEVKPIVYSEGSFCWDNVSLKEWNISNWEVVGNIYENPNLLK